MVSSLLPYPVETGTVDLDGKPVLYVKVGRAPAHLSPITTSDGRMYRRRGATSRALSAAEEHEVLRGTAIVPVATGERLRVFVAMSFRTEEEPFLVDYYRAIERAVASLPLPIDLVRIDLVVGDYEISQEIMNQIDSCDVVIADFTLEPRNVYFELGYARGKGKDVIQTARRGTPLEFDVRNWRTEFYRNATELEEKISPALQAAYARATSQL